MNRDTSTVLETNADMDNNTDSVNDTDMDMDMKLAKLCYT